MSIKSKETVDLVSLVLNENDLGPNASKPVEKGKMPKFGNVKLAIQFGKHEISDHENSFLLKESWLFDGDIMRPLFVIECTAKQAKQHIKRFGSKLCVIIVSDDNKVFYEKARSGIEETFCKNWMGHLFQTETWYVNEETA